jgi:hypothetical protein
MAQHYGGDDERGDDEVEGDDEVGNVTIRGPGGPLSGLEARVLRSVWPQLVIHV